MRELIFLTVLAALLPAGISYGQPGKGEPENMKKMLIRHDGKPQYRIKESYYGPDIRFRDWEAEEGSLESAGGCLHIFGNPSARIVRKDYIYGGGGDVEIKLTFNMERLDENGHVVFHFNRQLPRLSPNGLRLKLTRNIISVDLKDHTILEKPHQLALEKHRNITVRFVTLGLRYGIVVNGKLLTTGHMDPPGRDNEGWMVIEAEKADIRLQSFEENFIIADKPFPKWHRTELLYEETFTDNSLDKNWIVNKSTPESGVRVDDDSFMLCHMSNAFIKERFEGPVAIDCTITPMPTIRKSAGISDAIFIWMADIPEGDFLKLLNKDTSIGDASLKNLLDYPFYWLDFGGSNNRTTRMRRHPRRRMIRQFVDRPRLMERDRTYQITCVQNGDAIEFHVDGEAMIRIFDESPLTQGYVGFRVFVADLRIEKLKVWKIAE